MIAGVVLFACLLFLQPPGAARAAELDELGFLVPGLNFAIATGMSADASVVVGYANGLPPVAEPFVWTPSGGMTRLATLNVWDIAFADAVSGDGSTVVGCSLNNLSEFKAVSWSSSTGAVTDLGTLGTGVDAEAFGVNRDGSVIVGISELTPGGLQHGFLWSSAGGGTMISLGTLGGLNSGAWAVNSDGSVVVGTAQDPAGDSYAFRWEGGVMTNLGDLAGFGSEALGVSDDGRVVVGYNMLAGVDDSPFRWTRETGMVALPTLGGTIAHALAASQDGSVVVGADYNVSGLGLGFYWTDLTGVRSIDSMLSASGVDMSGITVIEASDVTPDGTTILGSAELANGDIEPVIVRNAGITTHADLDNSLAKVSSAASDVSYMAMGTMRAIMDQSTHMQEPGQTKVWAVASALSDSDLSGEDFGGETGFGATRCLDNGLSIGGGMFLASRSMNLDFEGNQKTILIGPGGFLSYAPEDSGVRAKLGAFAEFAELDLKRGYRNGAGSAASEGTTTGSVTGLNAHLGWLFPVTGAIGLQPFAEYEFQYASLDGYTESGGPFPAHFDQRRDTMNKTRVGLKAQYGYSDSVDLWSWAVWSHRFESKGPSMDGYLLGLSRFSYGGGPVDTNWGDVGIGGKWRLDSGVEAFSRLTAAVDNQYYTAPDLAINIGLAWSF
jgi:probable extracellular repeat, HAF family